MIRLRGKSLTVRLSIVENDVELIKRKMRELIIEKPIDAFFAKVKLDQDKMPIESSLVEAANKHIVLKFNL